MIFNLLSQPVLLIAVLAAIIIAFTIHEFSHAYAAELLGDNTPKSLGRLTLNPIAHIDPLGFFLLIIAGFGWGKPVPFNQNNLKDPKWGSAIIGLAGPASNLVLAVIAGISLSLLTRTGANPQSLLFVFLTFLIQFNVILLIFNLLPIPPLDGSKLLFALLPHKYDHIKRILILQGPFLLLFLIIIDRFLPVSILGRLYFFFLNFIERILIF